MFIYVNCKIFTCSMSMRTYEMDSLKKFNFIDRVLSMIWIFVLVELGVSARADSFQWVLCIVNSIEFDHSIQQVNTVQCTLYQSEIIWNWAINHGVCEWLSENNNNHHHHHHHRRRSNNNSDSNTLIEPMLNTHYHPMFEHGNCEFNTKTIFWIWI